MTFGKNEDEFDDAPLEARYTNFVKVGHNAFEFVVDFGQYYSETEHVLFHSRIVTGPRYAKEMLNIIRVAVGEYEEKFGVIKPG